MNIFVKCLQLFVFILMIEIIIVETRNPNLHKRKRLGKKTDLSINFSTSNEAFTVEENTAVKSNTKPEVDVLSCPTGCVCQYAQFMDLPISRWITYIQRRQPEMEFSNEESDEKEDDNDNQEIFDDDDSFLTNTFIKQATCIIQIDVDTTVLVNNLPHDLQALVLLYTGVGHNKTVNTSALKTLNQLTTLEIRGTQDRTLSLVFDEPLRFIQHANFESITLLGSDAFKRPKNPVHPSDSFDYKPKIELYANYDTVTNSNSSDFNSMNGRRQLGFETPMEEIEILPYNVYKQELKKARMPSFYGWKHLEVLRIHACNMDELYWEMFDGLDALQHLSLERNDIVAVPAFALYGALHIKTLSLAHNYIQDLHYRALAGLLELEALDLNDNRLAKLSELSFPPFPKLERIDFRQNPLRHIFPATFWVMNETREMRFDSQEQSLELWPNEAFDSLWLLRVLSIENVLIGNLEQKIFKGLSSLEKLKLRGSIHTVDFDAFAGLFELLQMDLSYCGIQEISMDALMGLKKLIIIDLSHNNISYIPPGLFDDQTSITEIYLQNNRLQKLPTTFFPKPTLRLMRLNNNPWKCSCDMTQWRAKIINQERGSRTERCISNFQTGRKIACRYSEGYKFDNRHAPRCDNYNGRSVFYVLRKQLNCGASRVVHRQAKQRNHKTNTKYDAHHQKRVQSSNNNDWKLHREQKMRLTLARSNSLDYVLQHEQGQWQKATNTSQEISNEVWL